MVRLLLFVCRSMLYAHHMRRNIGLTMSDSRVLCIHPDFCVVCCCPVCAAIQVHHSLGLKASEVACDNTLRVPRVHASEGVPSK